MKTAFPFGVMAFPHPVTDQFASGDPLQRQDLARERRKMTAIAVAFGIFFGLAMIGGELVVLNWAHS